MKTKNILTSSILTVGLIMGSVGLSTAATPTPTPTASPSDIAYAAELAAYKINLAAYVKANAIYKTQMVAYRLQVVAYQAKMATYLTALFNNHAIYAEALKSSQDGFQLLLDNYKISSKAWSLTYPPAALVIYTKFYASAKSADMAFAQAKAVAKTSAQINAATTVYNQRRGAAKAIHTAAMAALKASAPVAPTKPALPVRPITPVRPVPPVLPVAPVAPVAPVKK